MSKFSRTYTLSKGDTLEVLSKKFHLSANDIKKYHNTYCHVKNGIFFDIPTALTEIILPPKGVEINDGKIVNLHEKNEINFSDFNHELLDIKELNHTYGVVIKRKLTGKVPLQFHYKIKIKYLKRAQQGLHELELHREQVYINDKMPERLAEILADDCGSVMYPINVLVSKTGRIVNISNAKEIKRRWGSKKLEIDNYYKSSIVKTLLSKMDEAYANKISILKALKTNLFVNLFFTNIYRAYDDFKSKYKVVMPISPFGRKYVYNVVNELEPFLTDTEKVKLRIKGSAEELGIKSNLDMHYKLTSSDNIIFSIQGNINTIRNGNEEKIEFQAHHIDHKKNKTKRR